MTELPQILQSASDSVFTVLFRKKPTDDSVAKKISEEPADTFTKNPESSKFAKSLIEGDECLIKGHLIKCENTLGRSTVIDLSAKHDSKFRQVDHRTIEYIILKNVKYSLKAKGGKKAKLVDDSKKLDKWDVTKVAAGNWLSASKYYKLTKIDGDEIELTG